MANFMGNAPIRKAQAMTPPQIHLAARELSTQQQVSTCLQILGMCITACNIKAQNMEYSESSVPSAEKALPGEALIAAENTFIKACARLDSILEEAYRWDSKFQQQIEQDYKDAIKLNLESLEAQKKASLAITAPHNKMNPTLVRLLTQDWAAYKGNLESPTSIIGIGPTPEAALEAFDEAFRGRVTPYTQDWLNKHGIEQNEQASQVDPKRGPNPNSAPKPERKRRKNRRSPRDEGAAGDPENQSPS